MNSFTHHSLTHSCMHHPITHSLMHASPHHSLHHTLLTSSSSSSSSTHSRLSLHVTTTLITHSDFYSLPSHFTLRHSHFLFSLQQKKKKSQRKKSLLLHMNSRPHLSAPEFVPPPILGLLLRGAAVVCNLYC